MDETAHGNFAARLIGRLTDDSRLSDAASGERIDAAELRAAVTDFAQAFHAAGLRSGERVLIACNLSPLSAVAYLGAMFGGFVAVPLNESALHSSAELCSRARARALWTEQAVVCEWAEQSGLLRLVGRPPASTANPAPVATQASDVAALMPTSGSTNTPRLVQVTHGNLIANTEAIVRSQRLGTGELAMLILPVSYCFGASVLHTHLYVGGGVVFDRRFMFPDKVLRAIAAECCTTFAGVPTAYSILLRRSNLTSISLPSLRRFLQAGGSLAPELVQQIGRIVPHAEFFVMYGQTEATARIACLPPEHLSDKRGSVGVPLDNLTVRIVDSAGTEAAPGQTGELWVSGESICAGYFDEPEESARKFRDGWLATGDIARRDADGYLWITGRMSEFIKMRGVRVSFSEIESMVAALPGVTECAATAVPHVEAGEALALYIVGAGETGDLVAAVRRGLPREWICDSITRLAELPRNSHGKLLRARLPEAARAAEQALLPDGASRLRVGE
jgi:acyl-CoA synthetase (AMP-forming)/AMP-acid ligase II